MLSATKLCSSVPTPSGCQNQINERDCCVKRSTSPKKKMQPEPEPIYILAKPLRPSPATGGYVKLTFSFRNVKGNLPPPWLQASWSSLKEIIDDIGGRLDNLDRSCNCTTLIPPESHVFVGKPVVVLPAQQGQPAIKVCWM